MSYEVLFSVAVEIQTAIITGGLILVCIEIGNRKNREIDRFSLSVNPFAKKISAYLRLVGWCAQHIQYPDMLDENEENLKSLFDDLGGLGDNIIMSGENYVVDNSNLNKFYELVSDINNVWYCYDRMPSRRLKFDDSVTFQRNFVRKEIEALDSLYLSNEITVELIADISGNLYTDVCRPFEIELYRHAAYVRQYVIQTWIVSIGIFVLLCVLCSMLFILWPVCALRISIVFSIVFLAVCMMLLAIDMKTQIRCTNKISKCFGYMVKIFKGV